MEAAGQLEGRLGGAQSRRHARERGRRERGARRQRRQVVAQGIEGRRATDAAGRRGHQVALPADALILGPRPDEPQLDQVLGLGQGTDGERRHVLRQPGRGDRALGHVLARRG